MPKRKPTEVPASLKTIDINAILRKRGVYLRQKTNQELKEVAKTMIKSKKSKVKVSHKYNSHLNDNEVNAYAVKQIHVVETIEAHLENKLNQFIKRIESGFLAHLEEEISTKKLKSSVKGYFDENEDELRTAAQLDFTPLLENVATLAGQNALHLVDKDGIYMPFGYRDVIKRNVDKFANSLIDTDKDVLTNYLSEGIANGESVAEIRKRITDNFEDYNKMQAQRITRTEVMRVSNQASQDAWQQSGVVEGKQWVIYGATDECANYDGEIVVLDGNFYSSDSEFQDGDPPLHPNCKCVLIPIVVKD